MGDGLEGERNGVLRGRGEDLDQLAHCDLMRRYVEHPVRAASASSGRRVSSASGACTAGGRHGTAHSRAADAGDRRTRLRGGLTERVSRNGTRVLGQNEFGIFVTVIGI